jgi:fatty-acyl-CoA synthase
MLREAFGVAKGDRVAVLAHNCPAFVELFFAVGKIGAILTPLNWRLSASELEYIMGDCQPRVLFYGAELAETAMALCESSDLPTPVCLDAPVPDGAPRYEEELAKASASEPTQPPLAADDTYCILYTSGTTGKPKGAMIPHRQVLWNCINTAASWGLSERDVSPVFTPMFHAGGLFAFLTPLLYLGGRIVLGRVFTGGADLRVIAEERCTVILGVPTIFTLWRESPEYEQVKLDSVRFFISGGAPCPHSLMAAWRQERNVVFRQGYGLTEVGPNCFAMTDEDSLPKSGSIGRPIMHSQMRLVDAAGQQVAVGEVGELLIRGPHVCTGYWGNPKATEDALRDGWFHTGDMARCDEHGFYYIAGRSKEMIISGGENVYAAEVEAVFNDHPGVAESVLIGEADDKWGEVGVMVVIPRAGRTIRDRDLLEFCSGRLARYKIPKRVVFADDVPRTALGKPQKQEIKRIYAR